ncbi:uncharacterized protein HD556DRAFT_1250802, partial [Suillus plorans]
SGHSFSVDGTMAFLLSGVPPYVVQGIGYWSSHCFLRYWHSRTSNTVACRILPVVQACFALFSSLVVPLSCPRLWAGVPGTPLYIHLICFSLSYDQSDKTICSLRPTWRRPVFTLPKLHSVSFTEVHLPTASLKQCMTGAYGNK